MFKRFLLALCLLFTSLGALIFADGSWKKDFQEKFNSKNSWEQYSGVSALDPDDKEQVKMLLNVLKVNNWYLRSAAWKKLSQASSNDTLETFKKELAGSSMGTYRVREGILMALEIKKDSSFIPLIIKKLKDTAWPVKKAACSALEAMPDKNSIGPIIKCWQENKKNLRVWVACREALEKITNRFIGNDPKNWENWWAVNERSFQVGSKDEEGEKKAEASGAKTQRVQTVLRGVGLDFSTRGKGEPLFVIPDYGFNENYLMPYLAPLENFVKIYYIKLPPITSFQNVQKTAGMIVYPVDQLVDAFDALREQHNQKKIAILGHGVSSWVAMKYASKYPQRVSHLIVVAGYSGQAAYSKGVETIERTGKQSNDMEMEHFAQSLQIQANGQPRYQPKSQEEGQALQRKEWTMRFADQGDADLGWLLEKSYKPDAQAIVPPFELSKEPSNPIPVAVIFGKYALFTSEGDGQKIANHYGPKARFYLFPRSSRMPFIEENLNFVRLLEGFFRKY